MLALLLRILPLPPVDELRMVKQRAWVRAFHGLGGSTRLSFRGSSVTPYL